MQLKQSTLALASAISLTILTLPAAHAAWVQADHVESNTTGSGSSWHYEFTVFNDSTDPCFGECGDPTPVIIDWELPYFVDMGITNILSPFGWTWSIETVGVANVATGWDGVAGWITDPTWSGTPFASATQVLHWYLDPEGGCGGIFPGRSLGGEGECGPFGFDALYGPTDAPYQSSWDLLPIRVGDPNFPVSGVASPCALGQCGSVPEPGSLGLLAIGAAAGLWRRKKQS